MVFGVYEGDFTPFFIICLGDAAIKLLNILAPFDNLLSVKSPPTLIILPNEVNLDCFLEADPSCYY